MTLGNLIGVAKGSRELIERLLTLNKTAGEYGCVMINLNPSLLINLQHHIKAEDIYTAEAGHGLENEPHVTVLYGLHGDVTANDVKKVINDSGISSVRIKLEDISVFECDKYDVLKIGVKSDQLNTLNGLLKEKLPYTNSYKDYKPHVTIAYLKKGKGKDYLKLPQPKGYIKAYTWIYSTADREKSEFVFKDHAVLRHIRHKLSS